MLFMGKKKILIIEDDVNTQDLLQEILSEYKVTSAKLGGEGLKLIEKNTYDLLILDLNLPDMTGGDIMKQIKDKKLKTIIITGYLASFIKDEMVISNLENIIQKPFKVECMREAVAHALQS